MYSSITMAFTRKNQPPSPILKSRTSSRSFLAWMTLYQHPLIKKVNITWGDIVVDWFGLLLQPVAYLNPLCGRDLHQGAMYVEFGDKGTVFKGLECWSIHIMGQRNFLQLGALVNGSFFLPGNP